MTFKEFYKKYNGKLIDYDHVAGVQCVDLIDQYLKDVFNITGVWVSGARDFYTNFHKYPKIVRYFKKVANTRELIVNEGDIIIWNGGTWGHCAIGTGYGDIDYFESFEQNTKGKHEAAHIEQHRFNDRNDTCYPVLGVLRAREQYQYLITGYTRKYKVILKEGLNIRNEPALGKNSNIVGEIPYGEIVTICQIKPDTPARSWGRLADGRGYICMTDFTVKLS